MPKTTTPRLPTYTVVPKGKYADQGRPSYAHVYRDGTLCHAANGRDCIALAEAYVDEHDPIRQAVRSGMLIPLDVCTRKPGDCAYAHHPEILCTALSALTMPVETDATWYVCRGICAAAEVAATREGER